MLTQRMIMSSPKQSSLLHLMSSFMFIAPYIYLNQLSNDNVHQSPKVVSNYKNIHSLSGVAKENVGNLLLNMCSTYQNNSCDNILKCIMGCCMLTLTRASKQMNV
jgi:hypothetical protein